MKIFCVGLPRSGTNSFCKLCENLGFDSIHAPCMLNFNWYDQDNCVFADTPIWYPPVFTKLVELYPNDKFVYLFRNFESWKRSILAYWPDVVQLLNPVDIYCFGNFFQVDKTNSFRFDDWRLDKYYEHLDAVTSKFCNNDNFFMGDLTSDKNFVQKFMQFIGREGEVELPWLNRLVS